MINFNDLPKSLTKENFWDEMMEKYPVAMKRFCDWIDEYKKRVHWEELFPFSKVRSGQPVRTKYHDLPVAMQIGIFMQFAYEQHRVFKIINDGDGIASITYLLRRIEIND